MLTGRYIGKKLRLFKQSALLMDVPGEPQMYQAQFNNTLLPESFGWKVFNKRDFDFVHDTSEEKPK